MSAFLMLQPLDYLIDPGRPILLRAVATGETSSQRPAVSLVGRRPTLRLELVGVSEVGSVQFDRSRIRGVLWIVGRWLSIF